MDYWKGCHMKSEMELARAEIAELKAAVEFERQLRCKAESLSRVLAQELAEEREGREAVERLCEELAEAAVHERKAAAEVVREVEEERRMMRVAEVLREERVRMKLSEARLAMEEKLEEMEKGVIGVRLSVMGFHEGSCSSGNEFGWTNSERSLCVREAVKDRKIQGSKGLMRRFLRRGRN